jgi:hypothetical protein
MTCGTNYEESNAVSPIFLPSQSAYQAAILEITSSAGYEDLRIFNKAFSDSMINLVESAIVHLQIVMTSHRYDLDWMDLYRAVLDAVNDIAEGLRRLEDIVAGRVSELSHMEESGFTVG